ncbi:hypothetical protein SORBI_3006G195750 [Sorghum bicolor]|uniref:Uncharacterized protein n=1 Tax=Sorghum bicolor TaxID=4558 RepID=A0A1Z5RER4_SORBI|nr:hypothetical protein SORBI_3006G195750 [Sorghum bicolor]
MVVKPSRCLLAPPLSSCRFSFNLVKQRSIHPETLIGCFLLLVRTFFLLGWILFFLVLSSHSIYCGFACSDQSESIRSDLNWFVLLVRIPFFAWMGPVVPRFPFCSLLCYQPESIHPWFD